MKLFLVQRKQIFFKDYFCPVAGKMQVMNLSHKDVEFSNPWINEDVMQFLVENIFCTITESKSLKKKKDNRGASVYLILVCN